MKVSGKILIIVNSPFASGAEFSLLEYLKYSGIKKNDVYIALPSKNKSLNQIFSRYQIIFFPFKWYVRTVNPFIIFSYVINLIYITFKIRKFVNNHSISLIYSNNLKSHIYGLCGGLCSRVKTLFIIRDNLRNGFFKTILIKYSNKIVCISNHIYNQVNSSTKSVQIYNGIDLLKFKPNLNSKNLREELQLKNKIIIAQIGQITKWKNQIDFVRCSNIVINIRKDVHFLIIGSDYSGREKEYEEQIHKEIEKHRLANHLTILDHRNEICETYASIDILVHPVINEPFGRVVAEAMAMGKPVVSYKCGGPQELVKNGISGYLVEPNDIAMMAEKILKLINDEQLRAEFGRKGVEIIKTNFNIEKNAKDVDNLIISML